MKSPKALTRKVGDFSSLHLQAVTQHQAAPHPKHQKQNGTSEQK